MFMEWENLVTLCVGSTLLFSICFISWALLKLVGLKLTESEKGSTIYKTMSFILFYSSLVSFMYLVKYVCDMAILYRKPGVKEAMAVVSELTKLYIQ
jgi:uncharacterized membrane protein